MSEQNDLAPMREQVYRDPRPKEYFDRFHEHVRSHEPNWVYETVRVGASVYAYTFLRTRPISVENVPGSGAVILAPNHFSFMDHFLMGCFLRRKIHFMAKSQMFKFPLEWVLYKGGTFPVRRGARDEETFVTAEMILGRGGTVAMYCEGGRSRTGKLADEAKPGIGRLALESGAVVVPIAIHGSQRVRNWRRLQFPKVTVQFGEPMRWEVLEGSTREQQQTVADQIQAEIKRLYGGLEQYGRKGILRRIRGQAGGGTPPTTAPTSAR